MPVDSGSKPFCDFPRRRGAGDEDSENRAPVARVRPEYTAKCLVEFAEKQPLLQEAHSPNVLVKRQRWPELYHIFRTDATVK